MGELSRRTFLTVAGAGVVLSAGAGVSFGASAATGRRVYVVVLDGLRPDEVGPELTPNLHGLKAEGTWFPNARSLPVMETIPNHVMMMSGVRPDRSGVPANSVYDRAEQVVRDLDRSGDLRAPTVLERLRARGLRTGTVLSKEYLYGIFGTRASYRWEPGPIVPVSGHAPDVFTHDALVAMVDEADPHLVFANFGDCDRVGHVDLTGALLPVVRKAAVLSADEQLGSFVQHLKDTGRWSRSVLVVLADHSMDWSLPAGLISLQPAFDADPLLAGKVVIAQNGGADLLYWTGSAAQRGEAVARMTTIAGETAGVLSVHSPSPLRLGPEAGDLVVYCQAGWRFSDPEAWSNPIPGNHGHPATTPIPFLIAGGDPAVRRGAVVSTRAHTVDVAPTVGSFFGLPAPSGGYDGTARVEAFG